MNSLPLFCGLRMRRRRSEMGRALIDLTGQRFGRLTVIRRDGTYSPGEHSHYTSPIWLCRCDCGTICRKRGDVLRRGRTISCGCYRDEVSAVRLRKIRQAKYMQQHPRK